MAVLWCIVAGIGRKTRVMSGTLHSNISDGGCGLFHVPDLRARPILRYACSALASRDAARAIPRSIPLKTS